RRHMSSAAWHAGIGARQPRVSLACAIIPATENPPGWEHWGGLLHIRLCAVRIRYCSRFPGCQQDSYGSCEHRADKGVHAEELDMDYVDWCDLVLNKLIEAQGASITVRSFGVNEQLLADVLFGDGFQYLPGYLESRRRVGIFNATEDLKRLGLVEDNPQNRWKVTQQGYRHVKDQTPLWEAICTEEFQPDQTDLLRLINQLSQQR